MATYGAKRLKFRNGERISILQNRATGLPVHEAVLFVANTYRIRGIAAGTIHKVVRSLALLHNSLEADGVSLLERLRKGQFPTQQEINRLAQEARYRADSDEEKDVLLTSAPSRNSTVISLERVRMRHKAPPQKVTGVEPSTAAERLDYMSRYLTFLVDYIASTGDKRLAETLKSTAKPVIATLKAQAPKQGNRARLGKREGIDEDAEKLLLEVIKPGSENNPWKFGFVQKRNQLIVVLLLATGMRRGELLGLRIDEIDSRRPLIRILRKADDPRDPRTDQPNAKTYDREIELLPELMKMLWHHINKDRRAIPAARKHPYVIVSDEGEPLTLASIDKMFRNLRKACPNLPGRLTSHVLRHTWNDRFSEAAEAMDISPEEEKKARSNQQGWSEQSGMAATYTKRYTERKGREVALNLQRKLEGKVDGPSK